MQVHAHIHIHRHKTSPAPWRVWMDEGVMNAMWGKKQFLVFPSASEWCLFTGGTCQSWALDAGCCVLDSGAVSWALGTGCCELIAAAQPGVLHRPRTWLGRSPTARGHFSGGLWGGRQRGMWCAKP